MDSGMERDNNTCHLLHSVKEKLSENGASLDVLEDWKAEKEKLFMVKSRYHSLALISEEIRHQLNIKGSGQYHDQQHVSMMNDALTRSELRLMTKFPILSNEGDTKVLGIEEDILCYGEKRGKNVTQALEQYFIPEIEKALKEKCRFLYEMHSSTDGNSNEVLTFSKACQLPATLEKESQQVERLTESWKKKKRENLEGLKNYIRAMVLELELTRELLSHEGFRSSYVNNEVMVNWLTSKCEALSLKVRALQGQVLKDTYTPETIEALKKIREYMKRSIDETEQSLIKTQESLLVYQSAGPELETLAKQFVEITTEIDNKKWALSQLQHSSHRTESIDV